MHRNAMTALALLGLLASLAPAPGHGFDPGALVEGLLRQGADAAGRQLGQRAPELVRQLVPSLAEGVLDPLPEQLHGQGVVFYERKSCGFCRRTHAFLQRHQVAYRVRDIDIDPAARREFDRLGGRGVPLILVDGQKLTGWDEGKLRALLQQHGYLAEGH